MKHLLFLVFLIGFFSMNELNCSEVPTIEMHRKCKEDKSFPKEYLEEIDNKELHRAMDNGDYDIVKSLIESGVNINGRSRETCIFHGNIFKNKHENGTLSIHGSGMTILEKAIEIDNLELIEYFLSKNANPLSKRIVKEEIHRMKTELGYKSYSTKIKTTALYTAIKNGRLDILVLMDKFGVDLNAICYKERTGCLKWKLTPLKVAQAYTHEEIRSYLISRGVKKQENEI